MIGSHTTGGCLSNEPKRCTLDSWLIFAVGMVVFTLGPSPEFIGFQTRFALFAQEMFRNGPTWFPTTYGRPYPDYPGTSTFLVYLLSLPFGTVTGWSAIGPTALTSALILVFTYRIGAIRSRRWGLLAVLFSVCTVEFLAESRSIALDQYTSLAATVCFYLAYSADTFGRRRRLWLVPLLWIMGFSFRGPIGLVVPAAVLASYYLWTRRPAYAMAAGMLAGILLALCMAGLLLAAKAQGGAAFREEVVLAQVTGRMHDRTGGYAYYLGYAYYGLAGLTSYAVSYPLAILVGVSHFKDVLRRRNEDTLLLGSLACWALIVLAGMSIPECRKARYILPIVPGLSLMAAYLFVEASPQALLLGIRRWLLRICSLLAPLAAVGVPVGFVVARRFEPRLQAHWLGTLAVLVLLTAAVRILWRRPMDDLRRDLALLAVGAAVVVVVTVGVAGPVSFSLEQTGPFVRKVEALQAEKPGDVVFFRVGPDGEDIKFMVNLSRPARTQFVTDLDAIANPRETHYIIAKEEVFRSLPADADRRIRVQLRGRIGHKDFVVFTLKSPQDG